MIDPRGALEEKDLYIEPHYDIAKLSHSIFGSYDFFNAGLYNIKKNSSPHLNIQNKNKEMLNIFKNYLKNNNYDYNIIRLFETSLFLSMLPFHIDNPHKIIGFILNAINIMEELEKNV